MGFRQDLQDLQDISFKNKGVYPVNLVNPVKNDTCETSSFLSIKRREGAF